MNHRQERREVTSGRASSETARRFGGALRREVGDLEVRLEEAQLRSSAFEQAGLTGEAARVLEESRAMVDDFHRRLSTVLAQAAVEREAERILASSDDVLAVLSDQDATSGGVLLRIPAGIGAAIASVAVLAMALVTLRAPSDRDLQAANDVSALETSEPEVTSSASAGGSQNITEAMFRSLTPVDRQVLESGTVDRAAVAPLLVRRRDLLELLESPNMVTPAVLAELDALVEQLKVEGVDMTGLLELERRIAEAARHDEPAAEEPTAEPTPEPEPAPSESEDGQPLVPFGGNDEPDPEPSPSPSPSPTSSDSNAKGEESSSKGEESDPKSEAEDILGQ